MNADAFRHFYAYHFSENRRIWDDQISLLSVAKFIEKVNYSKGSIRDQVVHLVSVDDTWFSALAGSEIPPALKPEQFNDRKILRLHWDTVEQDMRAYLANLRDEMLFIKPFSEGEDKDLILWQVLLHVVNHGTDHRAQILRILHDMDVKTTSQDYIFYVYDHP